MRFHRLTDAEITRLDAEMMQAADGGGKTWDAWCESHKGNVYVEFPSGEIMHKTLGLTFALLHGQGRLVLGLPIGEKDHFSAQGLEGKIRVVGLGIPDGVSIYRQLPRYRRAIYMEVRYDKARARKRSVRTCPGRVRYEQLSRYLPGLRGEGYP